MTHRKPCGYCGLNFSPREGEHPSNFANRLYCTPRCQKLVERDRRKVRGYRPPLPFTPQPLDKKREELLKMLNEIPEDSPARVLVLERLERVA